MANLREIALRIGEMFTRRERDAELDEELNAHLEMLVEENVQRGMSALEARRDALIKLGGIEQTKEKVRDRRGFPFLESVLQDIRFGLRVLRKSPGFTTVAIATLALGIGANTAIFSVINGLLLHPGGISDPDRLVVIMTKYDKLNLKFPVVSAATFADVRDSRDVFASAALLSQDNFNYTNGSAPERLMGGEVSSQWFQVFDAKPVLGRLFRPEEDQPGANREVILSYGTWKRLFGGDASIVGKDIELNLQTYKVVGVSSPEVSDLFSVQLWVPLGLPPGQFAAGNQFNEHLLAVARVRPDVSVERAKTSVPLLSERIAATVPNGSGAKEAGWGLFVLPLTEVLYGPLRVPMFLLLGAVGFVLLIACTNIAGLMLARASAREREFAVRTALGSTRGRGTRQALTECLLLAGTGTLLGLLVANYGVRLLLHMAPEGFPVDQIRLNPHVLAFAIAAGVLSGVFSGVVPAWHIAGPGQFEALKEGGRSATAGRERQRLRSFLVVGEVALALVLLVGAGLFLRSFTRLEQVNPGFDSRGVMTAAVALPTTRYDTPEKQNAFYSAVLQRLKNTPGVTSAASTWPLPFTSQVDAGGFDIEGRPIPPGTPTPHSGRQRVSSEYFSIMKIPLRAGRYFAEEDTHGTQPVVIVNEAIARRYWPNEDPVGKRIRLGPRFAWTTIIGVVATVSNQGAQAVSALDIDNGICYYPALVPPYIPARFFLARTDANVAAMAPAIRAAVHAVDPNQPVYDVKPMPQRVADSLGPQRLIVFFLGFFSGVAILLAALGLYGVLSYSVAQRTQEIGIRLALGARQRQVLGFVVLQGLRLVAIGILVGTAGALLFARFVSGQLFRTSATDPLTFAGMALVLALVALAACYIPARRAAKVDPMIALRYE